MKMLLFIPGFLTSVFFTLSTVSDAAPLGAGHGGRGFRSGFAARHAGLRPNFASRSNFRFNQEGRFFRRDRQVFFQPSIWPTYWYPYGDLNDYSYLDNEPDDTYQYADSSTAPAQLESSRPASDRGPIVIILKAGNSGTDPRQKPGYITSGYNSTASAGQSKIVGQDPNERIGPPADLAPEAN